MKSIDADGVYVVIGHFEYGVLHCGDFLMCNCDNPGIALVSFAIYLMEMEKHGHSQFIQTFTLSMKLKSSKKNQEKNKTLLHYLTGNILALSG